MIENTLLYVYMQHAELTPQFEQYLDDQGLSQVELLETAAPIIFWVLSKSQCAISADDLCST